MANPKGASPWAGQPKQTKGPSVFVNPRVKVGDTPFTPSPAASPPPAPPKPRKK